MANDIQNSPWRFTNTTSASIGIKTGPGTLHNVTISANGTSTPALVLSDSLTGSSGTILAYNQTGQASSGTVQFTFDSGFANGLYLAAGGGVSTTVTWI